MIVVAILPASQPPHTQAVMAAVFPPQADHFHNDQYRWRRNATPWLDIGPRRRYPHEQPFIEYDPIQRVWHRGGRRMHGKFRPKHYWTRPNDGKRSGAWGRFKDVLTSEGADVFITTSGDKRTLMRDRPQKHEWSGWPLERARMRDWELDPDWRNQDFMPVKEMSWTKTSSRFGARYNFRTRKYESPGSTWLTGNWGPNNRVWRDAQWRPNAKRSDMSPYNYQTPDEQWWTRVPLGAGLYPGGRPRI